MTYHSITVLITLVVYKIILVGIGVWASQRTHDTADFFLGGRRLGPLVASISASASSSSAWTLLGVSGAAFAWGLSALWLFPACVGGFLINWALIAPRLQHISGPMNAITLTDVLAHGLPQTAARKLRILGSCIIIFSLLFYVASQFQGSGKTFASTFDLSVTWSVALGALIIVFYTMVGGFWAVSVTDTLQGLVMAAAAVLLPLGALVSVGGVSSLLEGLRQLHIPGYLSLTQNMPWTAGVGFIVGLLGIGLGYPGQPHVVNRFMAMRDAKKIKTARVYAMTWAVLVYAGMLLLGFCGRVLFPELADKETVFIVAAVELFHPILAGVILAGVLSAIMSTADSQLLVAASAVSHDLPLERFKSHRSLASSRGVVLVLSAFALLLALFGTREIFSKVLFAWSAMGAAFGPLLAVRLFGGKVRAPYALGAMLTGFLLSVAGNQASALWDLSGTYGGTLERVLPVVVALGIALLGCSRKASSDSVLEPEHSDHFARE